MPDSDSGLPLACLPRWQSGVLRVRKSQRWQVDYEPMADSADRANRRPSDFGR